MPAQAQETHDPADRLLRLDRWARNTTFVFGFLLLAVGAALTVRWMVPLSLPRVEAPAILGGDVRVAVPLLARLERLEVENRRLQGLFALLLVVAGLLVVVGRQRSLDTLEARRLVLRDGRGRLRVGLTPESGLVLLDPSQRPRVELSAIRDGAALKLFDPTRQRRVELAEMSDGAVLAMSDTSERPRVALLGVSQDGPSLSLVDGTGAGTVAVGSDGPHIVLRDREKGCGSIEVTREGPRMVLADMASGYRVLTAADSGVAASPDDVAPFESEGAERAGRGPVRSLRMSVPEAETRPGARVRVLPRSSRRRGVPVPVSGHRVA